MKPRMITYTHSRLLDAIQTCADENLVREINKIVRHSPGDVNGIEPMPVLHAAARLDRPRVVSPLVKAGFNPDLKDKLGFTAMMRAVSRGHNVFCRELIKAGSMPAKHRTPEGGGVMHTAAFFGNAAAITLFLKAGCDPNLTDDRHRTVAHEAIDSAFEGVGALDVLKRLLKARVDLNVKDFHGETPAHRAARRGLLEVMDLLKSNGADMRSENMQGQTPLQLLMMRSVKYGDVATQNWVKGRRAAAMLEQICSSTAISAPMM